MRFSDFLGIALLVVWCAGICKCTEVVNASPTLQQALTTFDSVAFVAPAEKVAEHADIAFAPVPSWQRGLGLAFLITALAAYARWHMRPAYAVSR